MDQDQLLFNIGELRTGKCEVYTRCTNERIKSNGHLFIASYRRADIERCRIPTARKSKNEPFPDPYLPQPL